jgi:hypothetical protein
VYRRPRKNQDLESRRKMGASNQRRRSEGAAYRKNTKEPEEFLKTEGRREWKEEE